MTESDEKKGLITKGLELISEDNGNLSCMRIIVMLVVVTMLFNWTYYNMTHDQLMAFEWSDLMMLFGVLGGKIVQKKLEE